jgi:hypothetical protein
MAVDTRDKRASAIGEFSFMEIFPNPDGDISSLANRQQAAWNYPMAVELSVIKLPATVSVRRVGPATVSVSRVGAGAVSVGRVSGDTTTVSVRRVGPSSVAITRIGPSTVSVTRKG